MGITIMVSIAAYTSVHGYRSGYYDQSRLGDNDVRKVTGLVSGL